MGSCDSCGRVRAQSGTVLTQTLKVSWLRRGHKQFARGQRQLHNDPPLVYDHQVNIITQSVVAVFASGWYRALELKGVVSITSHRCGSRSTQPPSPVRPLVSDTFRYFSSLAAARSRLLSKHVQLLKKTKKNTKNVPVLLSSAFV